MPFVGAHLACFFDNQELLPRTSINLTGRKVTHISLLLLGCGFFCSVEEDFSAVGCETILMVEMRPRVLKYYLSKTASFWCVWKLISTNSTSASYIPIV